MTNRRGARNFTKGNVLMLCPQELWDFPTIRPRWDGCPERVPRDRISPSQGSCWWNPYLSAVHERVQEPKSEVRDFRFALTCQPKVQETRPVNTGILLKSIITDAPLTGTVKDTSSMHLLEFAKDWKTILLRAGARRFLSRWESELCADMNYDANWTVWFLISNVLS